jgi:hypothetical protein
MSEVGASGVLVGAAVGLGTLLGSALVALPFNPEVRGEAYRRWRRVRASDRVATDAVPVAAPLLVADEPRVDGAPDDGPPATADVPIARAASRAAAGSSADDPGDPAPEARRGR